MTWVCFLSLKQIYVGILGKLPGVAGPVGRLTFKEKLKWTGLILVVYFIMTQIQVFGISSVAAEQFELFETLLGASMGSLMSLGIGPIVTASIILQLMVGSKLIPWDLTTPEGKSMFQGTQKLMAIVLSIVEAGVYVMMGAVPAASPGLVGIVIAQIALGGIIVIFMDELISKWGFGSGVGLFIVAGVSKTIMIRALNPLAQGGVIPTVGNPPTGAIPFSITALGAGELLQAFLAFMPVIATVLVFMLSIYAQSIKVEIPLAFGSIRGFGRRWPLKFFYTSNIPVILAAALLANAQLMARISAPSILGTFDSNGSPTGGLIYFLTVPSNIAIQQVMIFMGVFALLGAVLAYFTNKRGWKLALGSAVLGFIVWYLFATGLGLSSSVVIPIEDMIRILFYSAFLIGGSTVFAIFWMATSGMDAKSVANQIQSTGMQIPGFRRDVRIIERVLNRYIPYLAVMGGAAVGALAAFADFTGALGSGTGILLATMIIYQLYEELAMQHMEDMHPALRKIMG
jgi:preprotein translocase subunit SecY